MAISFCITLHNGVCVQCKTDETVQNYGCFIKQEGDNNCGGKYTYYEGMGVGWTTTKPERCYEQQASAAPGTSYCYKSMDTSCPSGKTWQSSTCSCVDSCADYTLTSCPTGWLCDKCPSNSSKLKKNGCDTTNGYVSYDGDCVKPYTCEDYEKYSAVVTEVCHYVYRYTDGAGGTLTCYDESGGCRVVGPDYECWASNPNNPNYTVVPMSDGNYCAKANCFPAGTKITMADSTLKNIEDVVTGDVVLSYNEKTKELEPNRVLSPLVHKDVDDEMYELTINGNILKVTGAHRFYVETPIEDNYQCSMSYIWTAAEDLKVGDRLFMKDGKYISIQKILHYPIHETVYNLSVENNHTYFVEEGYLVHNDKTDIPSEEEDCDCSDCGDGWTPGVGVGGQYESCGHDANTGLRCDCTHSY